MDFLSKGRNGEARVAMTALAKAKPRDAQTWICAAWVEHESGNIAGMREAIERATRLNAQPVLLDILHATAARAEGDMDEAIARARRAADAGPGPNRHLALTILGDALFLADRMDELAAVLDATPELRQEPRGQLLLSRVLRKAGRKDEAEQVLRALFESNAPPRLRRTAGSALAKLLDSAGRYQEAFEAAKRMHATTGAPFDTYGMVSELEQTAQMAARGAFRGMRRAAGPIPPTALLCALPRSGTTLIEQMLDRHPGIRGLGESPATHEMARIFTSLGGWPSGVLAASPADLARIRDLYLARTRTAHAIPPEAMTLDKSVQVWRRLPAVAAALPGARLLRLRRDPRDVAISLFMQPFDAATMGWNSSLADIKRVIQAERTHVPAIAQALELQMLDLRYEAFVADTRGHLQRTLEFLGLPWHEECLAPEGSKRVAITLSTEQVRRPVNAESVGRWRNYAQHFDASWETLDPFSS